VTGRAIPFHGARRFPPGTKPRPPGDKAAAAPAPAAPRKFVTHHRFTADGVDLPYTAIAEDIDLKDRPSGALEYTGRGWSLALPGEVSMKQKTLRLFALAGILTTSWLLAERPGYAVAPCSEVHGQRLRHLLCQVPERGGDNQNLHLRGRLV
jgi:hypothetical protein